VVGLLFPVHVKMRLPRFKMYGDIRLALFEFVEYSHLTSKPNQIEFAFD
jgi:hypothetical protein